MEEPARAVGAKPSGQPRPVCCSFVVPVHRREDFAAAIRQKLVTEITRRQLPARILPTAATATDCMMGEKLRPRTFDRYYPELDR